jgi:hypothetical protein
MNRPAFESTGNIADRRASTIVTAMLQRCFLVVVRCACLLAISASLSAQTEVKLNELLAKSDAFLLNNNATDWLEIHNTSGQAINLGTAAFTDDSVPANRWEFPLGSRIEANGY